MRLEGFVVARKKIESLRSTRAFTTSFLQGCIFSIGYFI